MSVIVATSFSGSPGVSTALTAWAYLSPRPTLILEADVVGGSPILAGLWDGAQAHQRSILELVMHPESEYAERILDLALELPGAQDRWLAPTIGTPAQGATMAQAWAGIGAAAAQISRRGIDVLVDLGRYNALGAGLPLLAFADLVLAFTDTNLQSLNTTRIALPFVRAELAGSGSAERVGVIARVGSQLADRVRPYQAREIVPVIRPVPLLGTLPYAPADAATYSNGRPARRGPLAAGYAGAVRALIEPCTQHLRAVAAAMA